MLMFSEYWFYIHVRKPNHLTPSYFKVLVFFWLRCAGCNIKGSFDIGVFVSYWLKLNGPRFIYLLFNCKSNKKKRIVQKPIHVQDCCVFFIQNWQLISISPQKYLTWISKVIFCVYSVTRQPLFKCWQHTCKHDEWRQQRKLHHLAALGHHVSGDAARSDRESGVPSAAAASPLLHTADRRGGRRGWSLPGGHEPGPATAVPPSPPPPQ